MKKRLTKSLYSPEWEACCIVLKDLREANGITQTDLSTRLGMPQSFVSKVESGQRKLDLRQFSIYVRSMGEDPIEVFSKLLSAMDEAST
ncbi:MAG: helix-turn-helix domain-containing protein [Chthoniobacterales bacterium]